MSNKVRPRQEAFAARTDSFAWFCPVSKTTTPVNPDKLIIKNVR